MASLFGHGIVAFTIAKVTSVKVSRIVIVIAVISSILPDIDVLAFKMGIPYEHPFGHRGFTHSILFATVWALLISVFFKTAVDHVCLHLYLDANYGGDSRPSTSRVPMQLKFLILFFDVPIFQFLLYFRPI